ncbi:MAG: polysaccharide biosynthesis protein [Selenomonadaceae bacterium]|nr:polysaccharide biosynthesis protein [Selenomonadaceae bacterium]
MSIFKGKTLMITGGTGSFGNMVLKRFLDTDIGAIKIFSRDENKQDNMRRHYQNDKIKFHIGDVRDFQSVKSAMYGVDYIFHAAALKQVPSCEFFPIEAVKTNVLGTENVLNAAIETGVKKIVCLSTDKAAYPINAMGTSKAMMEKVILAKSRTVPEEQITICCTRYGNVMCSRGSVIPLFIKQIKNNQPITVTNPLMTRFLMDLNEAVDLVLFAFKHGHTGDLFIQKSPACTIGTLAEAVKKLFNPAAAVHEIGIRHGEKMFETLMTSEERIKSEDMGNYFRVPIDSRNLNYEKYFSSGDNDILQTEPYTSSNTEQLDVEGTVKKLLAVDYVQDCLKGREPL